MKLTVLGYWGAYPWNDEGTSSYLLTSDEFSLLIDAGSGTFNQLRKHIDPLALDAVILSHYHHDHIADLGVLQFYRQLNQEEAQPILPIYGHTEHDFYYSALTMTNVSQGHAYYEQDTIEVGPFSIKFLRTKHPVPCFAMRITEQSTGKSLVYTADSGWLDAFDDFVLDTDLLIADSYFLSGTENHPVHFSVKEVAEMTVRGNIPTVVLSHLKQRIDLNQLLEEAQAITQDKATPILATTGLTITI
ncbi:MBL fold metallo-hydrolase [Vagococcus xieshaowenii]|uniref:MBL fold metallo-hydrolase n=1 Tax=Vagococcus xieshaowenii TaxID=2562451 RepID=A0AAJ5JL75_9ENTE|nr:MBL fold metallo-hydrolase [Vagococcus xieshaowenii]QCA29114.1 MBL fold metallo-hydrolase [Vagococcus xieshaowenii]TFZ40910.1 MBL fold metallo-hydrolase [Vagococcus xieshaowenii]